MKIPFTEQELTDANKHWGCNCGPAALAVAAQKPLDVVKFAIPHFVERGFTNLTMMLSGLEFLRINPKEVVRMQAPDDGAPPEVSRMFTEYVSLVRVQFSGPWTAKGVAPMWAHLHTHWVTTWTERGVPFIYDINGGLKHFCSWEDEVLPALLANHPKRKGWYPTHVMRIRRYVLAGPPPTNAGLQA